MLIDIVAGVIVAVVVITTLAVEIHSWLNRSDSSDRKWKDYD